jgi:thiol:disulfide interchange protein/DsbC/DsbD-like thiol-disulfide interchange protein
MRALTRNYAGAHRSVRRPIPTREHTAALVLRGSSAAGGHLGCGPRIQSRKRFWPRLLPRHLWGMRWQVTLTTALMLGLGMVTEAAPAQPNAVAAAAPADQAKADQTHTRVQLVLEADTVRPGDTVWAGVRLQMDLGWHTYWENPGESGAATEIEWHLPEGVSAGPIQWPVPEKFVAGGIVSYGLAGDQMLLVPLTFSARVPKGPLTLRAAVKWLECAQMCLPGQAAVQATITVADQTTASAQAALIQEAKKRLPQQKPAAEVVAWWEKTGEQSRPLLLEWAPTPGTVEADFFPLASTNFMVQGATDRLSAGPGKVRLRKLVDRLQGRWPSRISGVLVEHGADAKLLAAYQVTVPIRSAAPGLTVAKLGLGELLGYLGLAFLGGLVLNLMPCVLPVIALKVLSFVHQSSGSAAQRRKLGLVYGLGVVVSLWVLAGVVIGVQQAGQMASWGMQFQQPQFVVLITTVVTLVALNLFGVFEISLGGRLMDAAGTLAAQQGTGGAFFHGVLAVVLATPCTAPFLAAALGVAFTQPPAVIVLFFTAIALGLAAPYVVLSFVPGLLGLLPKPGPWMNHFKVAMGFPMLGTAVWLLTLATPHYGDRGVLWVGLFLVCVAVGAWIWGEFVQRGSKRKGLAAAMALAVVLAGYAYGLEVALQWRKPSGADSPVQPQRHGLIDWQPWSPEAVAQARAQGRPVLVDFTADWCLTCKANKTTSIEIEPVRAKLKALNAVALLADYTRANPTIAAELQRFGRAGVPLVVVYPKDPAKPPIVLPTLLTPSIVLEALDQAAR